MLLFFLVDVESLAAAFLPVDSLLVESLSDESPAESASLESVSSESPADEPLLVFLVPVEPERLEPERLSVASLSLLPRLSLSPAESLSELLESSSALVECEDELLPCP